MKVIDQLKSIDVMKIMEETGAVMQGHYRLTSGYHSEYYLQCAKLLQYPLKTSLLCDAALKEYGYLLNPTVIDTVVSPAMGGILFGYLLALKMGTRMIFSERKEKIMELRRGFELSAGEKVLIAEDVITTGGSVFEVIEICKKKGVEIAGILCIVDRSENISFNYLFHYLIKMQVEKYSQQDCPLCLKGQEVYYPGSRK